LAAILASIAMLLAPFLAFLYSPLAGLAIMVVALVLTAILLWDALIVTGIPRSRLRLLVGINLALALACLFSLIILAAHR
jgi:hypothetical protein